MADNGRLSVDQKVNVVLFYAETKSVVATQRRFRAHFGRRWGSLQKDNLQTFIRNNFDSLRINSVPDVKGFCENKNVLCVQSMVWHFVRHPVFSTFEKKVQACVKWQKEFRDLRYVVRFSCLSRMYMNEMDCAYGGNR